MFKEPLRKQIEVKGIGLGLEDNGIQGPYLSAMEKFELVGPDVPLCFVLF